MKTIALGRVTKHTLTPLAAHILDTLDMSVSVLNGEGRHPIVPYEITIAYLMKINADECK